MGSAGGYWSGLHRLLHFGSYCVCVLCIVLNDDLCVLLSIQQVYDVQYINMDSNLLVQVCFRLQKHPGSLWFLPPILNFVIIIHLLWLVKYFLFSGRPESSNLDRRDSDGDHAVRVCGRHSQRSRTAGRPDQDLGRCWRRRPT